MGDRSSFLLFYSFKSYTCSQVNSEDLLKMIWHDCSLHEVDVPCQDFLVLIFASAKERLSFATNGLKDCNILMKVNLENISD